MESGKIFVGGLNHESNKDSLKRHFSSYGEVTDCVVMAHPDGKSRGFGFVTFADPDAVSAALANQIHEIDGKVVDPKQCSARGSNNGPPRGGGGGGSRPNFTGRTTKIFIGGLPNDANEDSIKSFFSSYGKVVDVVIMKDQNTQKPRGFGFLSFDNEAAVDKASDDHYVNFHGKQIEVKKAEPRQGGGGGGGGGPGGRRPQSYNQDQGWGDGWNQNQSYGYQQQQNWQNQSYPSQGGYNQPQQQQQQQQYGGQQSYGTQGYSNGQSYGGSNYGSGAYGGYGAQGYGGNQGYSGSQGSGANQGYSSGQGYGGSDGYGGSGATGKSSSGGGSQGYHPYKR